MRNAEYTLESANEDFEHKRFNWCCFKAQQAAEYAVKGLLYGFGSIPTGHSITRLIERLRRRKIDVSTIASHARLLDRHYIPARYPNLHPEGAPYEYYDEETAKEALKSAETIINFVKKAASKWK